jgi:hypothetical protein
LLLQFPSDLLIQPGPRAAGKAAIDPKLSDQTTQRALAREETAMLTESELASTKAESVMTILMMIIPIAIIVLAFEFRHEGLRSASRLSNEASRLAPAVESEWEEDDFDFFE